MSNKVTEKKIKMPLWQDLVYMAFVAVAPIVITCIELFNSHSSVFKFTFASVGAIFVTVIVIRKYILNSQIERLKREVYDLEHDYSIANGNDKLIEVKWKKCKLILYCYNAAVVLLALVLAYLFITALVDGLIAFRGAITFILLFVLVGMIFKIICYASSTYEEDGNEDEETNR